ncbi:nitroreductase [Streptomyces sp. HU2014]|nr:nitroreductase [Streptomyces sp. HU2014]UQI44491.1 nitroreductase [Streptomyces sp. HU2014]
MNVEQTVLARRSATRLTGPGPDDRELAELVELAMTAPDHGRLSPWRLVVLRGDERRLLGGAMAEAAGGDPADRERTAAKALRAPLLISVVLCPQDHPKVPRWEQLAATVCAVQTLILLLHERGWGSIWRTGALADAPPVRRVLGLAGTEQSLGWLYIGTSDARRPPAPRPPGDGRAKLSSLLAPVGPGA